MSITGRLKQDGLLHTARFAARAAYCEFLMVLAWPLRRKSSRDPYHLLFEEFVAAVNALGKPAVLEIGSRNVSGNIRRGLFPRAGSYTGFDIHPGENVDVVGDAHSLSSQLPHNYFDAVMALSVFEHLLMPWKVVLEINRVLKPGGKVFISTHPTWPNHEMPWDFLRFHVGAFDALFNESTGFRVHRCIEGLPCGILPFATDSTLKHMLRKPANLAVAVWAEKTKEPDPQLAWEVDLPKIITTTYPRPERAPA